MTEDVVRSNRVRVGQRISVLREAQGLTVRKLADMAGVNYSHLSQIENAHKSPTIDMLTKICEALDVEIEDLFVSTDDDASASLMLLREAHAADLRIGKNLASQRKSQGLSARQLARDAGIDVTRLQHIERGESSATANELFRFGRLLQTEPRALLCPA